MATNRNDLKSKFKSGAKPTEADFGELIDSMWNIEEQGGGIKPLKIDISGDNEGWMELMNGTDSEFIIRGNSGGNPMLSISGRDDKSYIHIEGKTGSVGIGTTTPSAKIHLSVGKEDEENAVIIEAAGVETGIVREWIRISRAEARGKCRINVEGWLAISDALTISECVSIRKNQEGNAELSLMGREAGVRWTLSEGNDLHYNEEHHVGLVYRKEKNGEDGLELGLWVDEQGGVIISGRKEGGSTGTMMSSTIISYQLGLLSDEITQIKKKLEME